MLVMTEPVDVFNQPTMFGKCATYKCRRFALLKQKPKKREGVERKIWKGFVQLFVKLGSNDRAGWDCAVPGPEASSVTLVDETKFK